MRKTKLFTLSLAAILAAGSLAGCGKTKAPEMPSAVIERYVDLMEATKNYHADMEMKFNIQAKGDGLSVDLPIHMGLSADMLDEQMHGNMDLSLSFMGQDVAEAYEVYIDGDTSYVQDSGNGDWTILEDEEGNEGLAFAFSDMKAADFENAKLEIKDDEYIITQSFEDFAATGDTYDMLEDVYGGMAENLGVDSESFLDDWKTADVIYTFDKDFYLISASVENCRYSGTVEDNGTKLDMDVSLDLSFKFSDYGKIEKSDVEVPEKIRQSAVHSEELELNFEDDEIDEDLLNEPAIPYEGEDLDPGFSVTPAVADDVLGSYNGTPLSALGDKWDVFENDGWRLNNDDGAFIFVTAENPKYEGVDLYIYNESRADATAEDILKDGCFSYDINCALGKALPPMTFNGVTFGASVDDVIAAYGEAYELYEGTLYNAYTYDMGGDTSMTFFVYPDKGLQEVRVDYYGGL